MREFFAVDSHSLIKQMTIPTHQIYRIAKGKSLVTLLLSTYPIHCTRRYSINGDEPRQQSQLFMFPSDHIVERLFSIFASERNVSWCQKKQKNHTSRQYKRFFRTITTQPRPFAYPKHLGQPLTFAYANGRKIKGTAYAIPCVTLRI
jgi:hypothetical protein